MIRIFLRCLVPIVLIKLVIIFLFFESSYAEDKKMIKCFNKYSSYYSELFSFTRRYCQNLNYSDVKSIRKEAKCILKKLKRAKSPEEAWDDVTKCADKYKAWQKKN